MARWIHFGNCTLSKTRINMVLCKAANAKIELGRQKYGAAINVDYPVKTFGYPRTTLSAAEQLPAKGRTKTHERWNVPVRERVFAFGLAIVHNVSSV